MTRRGASEIAAIRTVLGLFGFRRGAVAVVVALGLLASVSEGIGLYLFLPLFDTLAKAGDGGVADLSGYSGPLAAWIQGMPAARAVLVLVALVVASIAMKNAIAFANAALFAGINCRAGHVLRSRLYRQILGAGALHLQRTDSGQIANAMLSETWRTVEALGIVYRLIVNSIAALVLLALLAILSWQGALIVLPVALIIQSLLYRMTRRTRRISTESVAANSAMIGRFWETMEGLPTIRSFDRADPEQARFDKVSDRVRRVFLRMQLIQNTITPTFEVVVACVVAVLSLVLFRFGLGGADIAVFMLVLLRLQIPLRGIGRGRNQLLQVGGAVDEVRAVGDACAASHLPDGSRAFPALTGGIRFENVDYTYPDRERPSLSGVTFEIPARSSVAIVGRSGAGKSTLISLLCRDMFPDGGAILADGTDLRQIRNADWRARIGLVPQIVHLFNASVADNIAYGLTGATRDQVRRAARLAHCDRFIEDLPKGYDTGIGDKGVRLSGGQRQRLALARALIREPDMLILDEATNSLDSESEQAIQTALAGLHRSMTLVSIAHRLSTVQAADSIVVLENGRIAEQGTAADLRRQGGLFAHLELLQQT